MRPIALPKTALPLLALALLACTLVPIAFIGCDRCQHPAPLSSAPAATHPAVSDSGKPDAPPPAGEIDPRNACLKATIKALEIERRVIEKELQQTVESQRPRVQQRADQIDQDMKKYSAMRPEEYTLPKPITVIGRVTGDQIYYIGLSRSGTFYHVVGASSPVKPDTRYKFRIYPLYPRWYPFPDRYVWVERAEEAEVVSIADLFNLKEPALKDLTRIAVWTADSNYKSWSTSDPQVLKKITDLLQALHYDEHPGHLDIPEGARVLSVALMGGQTPIRSIQIRGDRITDPNILPDAVDKEKELVEIIQTITAGPVNK